MSAQGEEPQRVPDSERVLVERLLNSVRFRYLSNHIHPSQLLLHEEDQIRRILFDRLGKSPSFSDDLLRLREGDKVSRGTPRRSLESGMRRLGGSFGPAVFHPFRRMASSVVSEKMIDADEPGNPCIADRFVERVAAPPTPWRDV